MTRSTRLVWFLTGLVLVGTGACSSDVTSGGASVPSVTEDPSISYLSLRVEGMT